jgi:carbonic anhydrase
MKKSFKILALSLLVVTGFACNEKVNDTSTIGKEVQSDSIIEQNPIESILTAQEQADMSPDEIIGRLKKGNENFVSNNLTRRDHSAQRREAMIGQYPKAIVLSCVDSRVPVEDVFDLGIGDIFVARVAGNIENADIVGSMEFATAVAGSKVVIVMGHTSCGAVKHAIDNTDAASMNMNSLQDLLNEIKPSIAGVETDGETSSNNTVYTNDIITRNAHKTVEDIRKRSPKMAELEKSGDIKIVAAVYDMASGKVKFM